MKKADILRERERHRGDPCALLLNFLVNYSAPARLMHSFLPPCEGKRDIIQAATRAYVIGIAACVETFFRDLYFYLLKRNPALLQLALKGGGRRERASRMSQYQTEGVSAEEFAASVSLQNAEAINKNISTFFSQPFFEVLDQLDLVCDVPSSRGTGPARLKLPPCWVSDLDRVFSLRHEFAHDANSKRIVSAEEMRRIETTALLICQMTVLLPGVNAAVILNGNQLPVVLLIPDLISEDWEVAEDHVATAPSP